MTFQTSVSLPLTLEWTPLHPKLRMYHTYPCHQWYSVKLFVCRLPLRPWKYGLKVAMTHLLTHPEKNSFYVLLVPVLFVPELGTPRIVLFVVRIWRLCLCLITQPRRPTCPDFRGNHSVDRKHCFFDLLIEVSSFVFLLCKVFFHPCLSRWDINRFRFRNLKCSTLVRNILRRMKKTKLLFFTQLIVLTF